MKVHLVSVLWLEATRKSGVRAPEKQFPAIGTESYDANITQICQVGILQIQFLAETLMPM